MTTKQGLRGEGTLNHYGLPITPPEYFDGEHAPNVPASGGNPPFCNCGWTRWQYAPGEWFELSDHLRDMNAAQQVANIKARKEEK